MSRFIDRLKKVTGDTPRPLGFGVARETAEKSRILLIAGLAQNNVNQLAEGLVKSDAVLLHASALKSSSKAIKGLTKAISEAPCGLYLSVTGEGEFSDVAEAGVDFIVFPGDTSISVLKKEGEVGKIIEVPVNTEVSLIRSANDLALDAVLISDGAGKELPLTCLTLMRFQLFAGLLEKPLLAIVPISVSTDELKLLWEAGISGVVIDVAEASDVEKIAVLRLEIEKTVFPPRRKRRKMDVSLPSISAGVETPEKEEEEEEEE